MKEIKKVILKKALELYTEQGVSNVSIRQIASELGISHSNLIYHFKTKKDILEALHQQLLEKAIHLNQENNPHQNFIYKLFLQTKKGFEILYDYRFFMLELNTILRENPSLKQTFLNVEKLRASMYKDVILQAIEQDIIRDEDYQNEYNALIEHIKIFSDSWLASSEIYDNESKEIIIEKYSLLLVKLFYPYCTLKGRKLFFDNETI